MVEVFIDELDLGALGFAGVVPEVTGRPSYHPSTMLKMYLYGYLNRIQSSRRLEREAGRNIELMWLTGRLMPDFKTIADFRRDNGPAIRAVCRQFVALCRRLSLFTHAVVAIDGSKFKAVNNRDKNYMTCAFARWPTFTHTRQPCGPAMACKADPAGKRSHDCASKGSPLSVNPPSSTNSSIPPGAGSSTAAPGAQRSSLTCSRASSNSGVVSTPGRSGAGA